MTMEQTNLFLTIQKLPLIKDTKEKHVFLQNQDSFRSNKYIIYVSSKKINMLQGKVNKHGDPHRTDYYQPKV